MRWIGCGMILAGSLGMALRYVLQLKRELFLVMELRDCLEMIESEIRYGKASLPECFLKVGKQKTSEIGVIFEGVGEKALTERGESLRDGMVRGLSPMLEPILPLQDLSCVLDFVSPQGFADEEMQRRALEKGRRRMEEVVSSKREELREKCRVAWGLGLTGGLFVILFLW